MTEDQEQTPNTYNHLLCTIITSLFFCIAVTLLYLKHKETLSRVGHTQEKQQ